MDTNKGLSGAVLPAPPGPPAPPVRPDPEGAILGGLHDPLMQLPSANRPGGAVTLTGDVTGSGAGSIATTLASVIPHAETLKVSDSGTNTQPVELTLYHATSGVPAALFGGSQFFDLDYATGGVNSGQTHAGRVLCSWADATNRYSRLDLAVYNGASAANAVSMGYVAGVLSCSFLGAVLAGVQTGDAGTALVTFGLMSGTPTFAGANVTGTVPLATSAGTCTGNAATVTTNANLTGPVTSAGNATQIAAGQTRGFIDGLVLSNDATTPATVLDVAAGCARDSTDAYSLYLSSAFTKTTGAWAAGTGNGGLDTGTVANSTWYHVYLISKAAGASVDVLFSTSATAPTMPSTYTLKRRIGSFLTDGSAHIVTFVQEGDDFFWGTATADVNASNPGTAAVTRTLTVPLGVKVRALVAIQAAALVSADNPGSVYLSDPALPDTAPSASVLSFYQFSAAASQFQLGAQAVCWTNTSSQIRSRCQISTAGTTLRISTLAWYDPRGRNG